jgi:integrase
VLYDIEHNSFDYGAHFPESKNAKRFGGVARKPLTLFKVLLKDFLALKDKALESSSSEGYNKYADAHLFPKWGEVYVQEITPAALRAWLTQMPYTLKYVRNILSVMRMVLDHAKIDGYISAHPMAELKPKEWVPRKTAYSNEDLIDPFSVEEMRAILAHCDGMEHNLYRFAFATGMRTSELFALRWPDIDFVRGVAHVRYAYVQGETKGTKTAAGKREVQLLDDALFALRAQKQHSFMRPDGVIWLCPRTGEPWLDDQQLRKTSWAHILKRAGVRYRYPYQTRHTFASHMLTNGESPKWVARQIGHRDQSTLFKHYDKWIADPASAAGYVPKTPETPEKAEAGSTQSQHKPGKPSGDRPQ